MRNSILNNKTGKIMTLCILSALLLTNSGCENQKKKDEEIITYYHNGVYEPADNNYIFTLPNENWTIKNGEENSENIVFTLKNNQIQIQKITEYVDEIIESLPKEQSQLEANLRREGIFSYQIEEFDSFTTYQDQELFGEINYAYYNSDTGKYIVERNLYFQNEVFILTGEGDSNQYESIKKAIQQIKILDEKKQPRTLEEPNNTGTENNLYTSYNAAYTLMLPYETWNFAVNEEEKVTTLTSENKKIVVSQLDTMDYQNAIQYEIPRNLDSLTKQIQTLSIGEYELISFHEATVDTALDMEAADGYREFYYLLKLKTLPGQDQYYAVYEYRSDFGIYKIVSTTTSSQMEEAQKLLNISGSFALY